MLIDKKEFDYNGKKYEIRITLENGDLEKGDFIAQAFLNGEPYSKKIPENAMKALAHSLDNNFYKSPFYEIINMTQCNIMQGFNLLSKEQE